ncbi:MAG TPA: hypothetical protein VGG95_13110 [Edaphobacter sp.]
MKVLRLASSLLVFAASALAYGQCNGNDASAPCFTNNSDILDGRTALLPDEDLVFNVMASSPAASFPGGIGFDLSTSNSQISSAVQTPMSEIGMDNSNFLGLSGRMFNQPAPQVVSAVSGSEGAGGAFLESPNKYSTPTPSIPPMSALDGASQLYGAAGDFLGNGVDQMVIVAVHLDPPVKKLIFQAILAKDPNNYSSGFNTGPASSGVNNASNVYAVTSGVFTDRQDGQPKPLSQIAVLSGNPGNGKGLTLSLYGLTSNLGFTTGKSINLALPEGNINLQSLAMVSGRFAGSSHDQLVIAYAGPVGDTVKLMSVDFDVNGKPIQNTNAIYTFTDATMLSFTGQQYGGAVWLAKGRFDWFSSTDQVAFTIATGGAQTGSRTGIVTFNSTMKPTIQSQVYVPSSGQRCHFALAAGRYDHMHQDGSPDPNLQLADITTDCGGSGNMYLQIYNVQSTANYAISLASSTNVGQYIEGGNYPSPSGVIPTPLVMSLAAGDLQLRSIALGPPEKATVTGHIQPDFVLGVPPMHVDWIAPAGGSTPEVLNVSVFPATFNTGYTFQSGQNGTVSRSGTTSYTASTKETASEKVSYGIPGIGGVSVESKQAAAQIHQNSVTKKYNTYSGQTSGFSTRTIFDDVVAATTSQLNIYSYRVIGQCSPSANAPASEGCAAGTLPVYMQFSGPDNVNYVQAAEGRNLEWYQPVWEPGNLFSYPANEQQLMEDLGGGTTFQPLTPTNNLWDSQTASAVVANWTAGGGSSVSSGSTSTHTFDASVSASGNVSFDGFGTSASAGFDYSTSSSTSTLNESTSTVSDSQGITLNRGVGGGPISSAVYDYQGQSFIYGQSAPEGTIQTDATPNTTVKAQGYIAAAHAVDVLSQGSITSGNFWPQAYTAAPDIALNHPQRWLQKTPSGVNPQQVQFNCPVGYTSSLASPSCSSSPEQPTPANVADASFYEMKGFFVTPGNTLDGPQITQTRLGSKVNIRARIYNYSLANLPAGSTLHVQFYAQPWGIGEFASVPGHPNQFASAIYLGEGTDVTGNPLQPVPAYCGGAGNGGDPCLNSSVRNWEFAYATWDTSKNGVESNSRWKFWVLVWVEQNGKLLPEIPGHGLASLPAGPYNSLGDVPIEPYSNNLGYYNQVFTVAPAIATIGAHTSTIRPSLILSNFGIRQQGRPERDHSAKLSARLHSTGQEIQEAYTYYYDGNPDRNGVLFDVQKIDHISSGRGIVDTASFTPKTCGPHWIYVRAIPLDAQVRTVTQMTGFNVTVDPVPQVQGLIRYVRAAPIEVGLMQQLLSSLQESLQAYQKGNTALGNVRLEQFKIAVQINRNQIPDNDRSAIQAELQDLQNCL